MKLHEACGTLLILIAALPAQSVGVSLSALTPLSAQVTDGIVSGAATHPTGALGSYGGFGASLPSATIANAGTNWQHHAWEAAAVVRLENWVVNPAGLAAVSGSIGPHEFLVEWTATGPVVADLRITRIDHLSPGVGAPSVQLDYDNDGTIDVVNVSTASPLLLTRQYGPQPFHIRILVAASLAGGQGAWTSLDLTATPHNDLSINEVIASCRPLSPPPPAFLLPSFVARGVRLAVPHQSNELGVIVVGTSPQPALLGSSPGLPCILLPEPQIVLWQPSGLHVPLPASLRPLTFHAQGVIWSPAGLLTTEGYAVTAF